MKRIFCILFSFVLVLSAFSLSACYDDTLLHDKIASLEDKLSTLESENTSLKEEVAKLKEKEQSLPSFADCEIGYQLEVYPKFAFDYELTDGTIVHIDSITATLTAKNEINEGDVVSGRWYPYPIEIVINGRTEISYAGFLITIMLQGTSSYFSSIVKDDGTFSVSKVIHLTNNICLYFSWCESI